MADLTSYLRGIPRSWIRRHWRTVPIFIIVLVTFVFAVSCADDGRTSGNEEVVFEFGDVRIVDDSRRYPYGVRRNPLLLSAVNNALAKYNQFPAMDSCADLASWYRDGLEIVFAGELEQIIVEDETIASARAIIIQTQGIFSSAIVKIIELNPSICTREDFLENIDGLPPVGRVAANFYSVVEERGGNTDISPTGHLRYALDIVEGVPLVTEWEGFDHEFEIVPETNVEP